MGLARFTGCMSSRVYRRRIRSWIVTVKLKIEFTLSLQRVDEDIRERLHSSSVSDMMAILKDGAKTVSDVTKIR